MRRSSVAKARCNSVIRLGISKSGSVASSPWRISANRDISVGAVEAVIEEAVVGDSTERDESLSD